MNRSCTVDTFPCKASRDVGCGAFYFGPMNSVHKHLHQWPRAGVSLCITQLIFFGGGGGVDCTFKV